MMINYIVFFLFLDGYDIHNPLSCISINYPREVACIWLPPIGIIKYVIICPEPGIYLKIYRIISADSMPHSYPQSYPRSPRFPCFFIWIFAGHRFLLGFQHDAGYASDASAHDLGLFGR